MATSCVCGFAELADESLLDHLALVFTPDDQIGNDGVEHEELFTHACTCGYSSEGLTAMDEHLLSVFTPADGIGSDGKKHGVRDAG